MSKTIKISLFNNEALFVEGVSLLFSSLEDISVTITANCGNEFITELEMCEENDYPNIALVDIQTKTINGFELVETLRKNHPDIKIIILSSHYGNNVLCHMIKLGVSAFIPKNADKELLIDIIKTVNTSGLYLTETDREMLMLSTNSKSKKPSLSEIEYLSDRETDVLKLICQEYTNQEIADKLYISKRTVEGHRQRILEKVGSKNTVGLVLYAIINEIHKLPQDLHIV